MTRPATHRLASAAYRVCLRALPARVRAAHADDMRRTFVMVVSEAAARGRLAAAAAAAAECVDVIKSAVAARMCPPLARRARQQSAERGGFNVLPRAHEIRVAARRLADQPVYSLVVVAVLALGIGINTVVFSVADALLLKGPPYAEADRLVELFSTDAVRKISVPGLAAPALAEWRRTQAIGEWRRQSDVFDWIEAFAHGSFMVTGGPEPEQIAGAYVMPDLFARLGVRPALGRGFESGEGVPGRDRLVLLSDRLWRRLFGADPGIVGRTFHVNDEPYTVIGVMPPGFRFPSGPQEIWLPRIPREGDARERMDAIARLAPGVDRARAQERVDATAAGLQESQPQPRGWNLTVLPYRGTLLNTATRRALQTLLGAVSLVLLIACANVANLFLTQALARGRELAIRAALGASRWRLGRELLIEGLLHAGLGGALGVSLSYWGVRAAAAIAPAQLVRWSVNEIGLDGRVLLYSAGVTMATGLLFAILPALRASRTDMADALKGRTAGAAVSHGRLRGALVVAEVALSVVLLVGAALLVRSFVRLQHVDPGIDAERLLSVTLSLPTDHYPRPARQEFLNALAERVRALPGVHAVTLGNGLPVSNGGGIHVGELEVEGSALDPKLTIVPSTSVAPDYFAAVGIRLIAGRTFGPDDTSSSAIVSRSMAEKLWPGENAVGGRFRFGPTGPWRTVIGIADEVRQEHLRAAYSEFELYSPFWPRPTTAAPPPRRGARDFAYTMLVVRADDPLRLVPFIKSAVWALDSRQPVGDIELASHAIGEHLAERRFALRLMAIFAALALLLAVAGLYAVLSQIVVQRRHEIGVRLALGAQPRDVRRLVISRGMLLVAIGLAIGLAGAWSLSRYLASQLYEVSARDPVSFAAVAVSLAAAALLACWLPTRRALAIEPSVALRE